MGASSLVAPPLPAWAPSLSVQVSSSPPLGPDVRVSSPHPPQVGPPGHSVRVPQPGRRPRIRVSSSQRLAIRVSSTQRARVRGSSALAPEPTLRPTRLPYHPIRVSSSRPGPRTRISSCLGSRAQVSSSHSDPDVPVSSSLSRSARRVRAGSGWQGPSRLKKARRLWPLSLATRESRRSLRA